MHAFLNALVAGAPRSLNTPKTSRTADLGNGHRVLATSGWAPTNAGPSYGGVMVLPVTSARAPQEGLALCQILDSNSARHDQVPSCSCRGTGVRWRTGFGEQIALNLPAHQHPEGFRTLVVSGLPASRMLCLVVWLMSARCAFVLAWAVAGARHRGPCLQRVLRSHRCSCQPLHLNDHIRIGNKLFRDCN